MSDGCFRYYPSPRLSQSDGDDFDVGPDRPHQALDPRERAGDRAGTAAARALVVDHEPVAIQSHHVEVPAIALQIGPHLLVEYRVDLLEALPVRFRERVGVHRGFRLL